MATKAAKAKKTAKAKTAPAKKPKSTKPKTTKPKAESTEGYRQPTDWALLKKMWEGGATYEEMAKKTDAHYDPNRPDATKPTRAKISRAHTKGIMIGGKLVHFGPRGKVKGVEKKASPTQKGGSGKKAKPKVKATNKEKTAKPTATGIGATTPPKPTELNKSVEPARAAESDSPLGMG